MKFIESIYSGSFRTFYIEDNNEELTITNSDGEIIEKNKDLIIEFNNKKYIYYPDIEYTRYSNLKVFKGVKSLLLISLETQKMNTRVLILITSKRYDALTHDKIIFLTNLIHTLKNRIILTELLENSVDRNLKLSSLFEIGNIINEPLKWGNFINRILSYSSKLLRTKFIYLYIFNKRNRLERYSLFEDTINVDTHTGFFPMINKDIIRELEGSKSYISISKDNKYKVVFLSLMVKNRLIGVIEGNVLNEYFLNNIEMILTFTKMVAISIENKKLIEENKAKRKSIESIINSLKQPIILINTSSEITDINSAAKHIFKINIEKPQDTKLTDVFVNKEFGKIFTNKGLKDFTFKVNQKHYYVNITHILNEDNNINGAILLFTDITAIKKIDSEIISDVSREIKVPISSIISGLNLISDKNFNLSKGDLDSAVDSIKEDFAKLMFTIDQLLTTAKT
jgi:hypothetical protein